ncbi:MAG: GntR family transcriptional regulator [Chloroflexi bacterium]|nr:GntR family transcriptional regulator [Chloroflexota bacterium]
MVKKIATVGSSTYQKIKRDIIYGVLTPGSKLKLKTLKGRYSASFSTLREALNRLSSDGFVESPEQRGFFVKQVSREDLIEIAELRVLLECHAIEKSVIIGDNNWEGNLVAAHHKLHIVEMRMLAGDLSERELWKRYDWEFHLALIEACKSTNLLSLHSILYDKYLRYQMLMLSYRGESAVEEHRAIFKAALERDAAGAKRCLEDHIRNGLADTLAAV